MASHLTNLNHLRLADRRNAIAAGTHSRAVDFVAAVDERDRADHAAAVRGIDVQLLAEAVERHFQVFDDGVALALVGKRLFLRPFDRVLEQIEQTSDAGRLRLIDQRLAAAGDEHRLHVALGLREIEEMAAVLGAAHLDEPLLPVVFDVRQAAGRDIEIRIAPLFGGRDHAGRQTDDLANRLLVAGAQFDLGGSLGFLGHGVKLNLS